MNRMIEFLIDLRQVLLALGILVALIALRKGLFLVHVKKAHRDRLNRLIPPLEVVVGLLYIIWVVSLFVQLEPVYSWGLLGGLALILLWASWFAVKDLVSGVILRTENAYRTDQWIRIGEIEGRIQYVGYRALTVEKEDGLQVKIPYSTIASIPLATSDRIESSKAHTFRLDVTSRVPVAEVVQQIREASLIAFWSSLTREPLIKRDSEQGENQTFEITVYTLDEAHASDVECAVRSRFDHHP